MNSRRTCVEYDVKPELELKVKVKRVFCLSDIKHIIFYTALLAVVNFSGADYDIIYTSGASVKLRSFPLRLVKIATDAVNETIRTVLRNNYQARDNKQLSGHVAYL